jgi:hypothetical protein
MRPFNFAWAFNKLLEGHGLTRDIKNWSGKKIFLARKKIETVDKKHFLYPHLKGDVIFEKHIMQEFSGVTSPYIPNNNDLFAEDWRYA